MKSTPSLPTAFALTLALLTTASAQTSTITLAGADFLFPSDPIPAQTAPLGASFGLALDPSGNLFLGDCDRHFVFKITPAGALSIAARADCPTQLVFTQSGELLFFDSDQLRKLTKAGDIVTITPPQAIISISPRSGLAVDAANNVYISEPDRSRIRRFDPNGAVTLVAGDGTRGFSGDGGPAAQARLADPAGLALATDGTLYIADTLNLRIRAVSPAGSIRTLATLTAKPIAISLEPSGNLIIATESPAALLRLTPAGSVTPLPLAPQFPTPTALAPPYYFDASTSRVARLEPTAHIAGSGGAPPNPPAVPARDAFIHKPFSVAVSPAGLVTFTDSATPPAIHQIDTRGQLTRLPTPADLSTPRQITFDAAGNLFIALGPSCALARLTPQGEYATTTGLCPEGVAVSPTGEIFASDTPANRIVRLSASGVITPFASNISAPTFLTFDAAGNLYVAETGTRRVRRITPDGTATNAATEIPTPAGLATDAAGNLFIADTNNNRILRISPATPPENYLSVGSRIGSVEAPNGISVGPNGELYIAETGANRLRAVVNRSPSLTVSETAISLLNNLPAELRLATNGQGAGYFLSVPAAAPWLTVTPVTGAAPATATLIANTTGLAPGQYNTTLTVGVLPAGPPARNVPVTLTVQPTPVAKLVVGVRSLHFQLTPGGPPATQTISLSNPADSPIAYTTESSPELSISSRTGSVSAATPATLSVTASPAGLAPGTYTPALTINGVRLPVTIAVAPATQRPVLSQLGLTFTAIEGGGPPLPQSISVKTPTASATTTSPWLSVATASATALTLTADPKGLPPGDHYAQLRVEPGAVATVVLRVLPRAVSRAPNVYPAGLILPEGASQEIRIANLASEGLSYSTGSGRLAAGAAPEVRPANGFIPFAATARIAVRNALAADHRLTLSFTNGTYRDLPILTVPRFDGCTTRTLRAVFQTIFDFDTVELGLPVPIELRVVDQCGTSLGTGQMVIRFTNGDPDLPLTPTGDGVWSGTWTPRTPASGIVTLSATLTNNNQSGRAERYVRLNGAANPPIVAPGSLVHAATQSAALPLAPGTLVTIYGTALASPDEETGIALGGQPIPLLFTSPTQINALIPLTLATHTTHPLTIRRGDVLSTPMEIPLAAAQPGIFTSNLQGTGQGIVLGPDQTTLADAARPVSPGQAIVIYGTGLGAVTTAPAPTPTASPVSLTIGTRPAQVLFAGLAPGFIGLYQVNALVPTGAPTGPAVPLQLTVAGQQSNVVTIAVIN